jgi:F420-non-reducing hydrogenase iron-sulfur subunit
VEETRELMRLLGIDERRLRLKWVSASEGALFAAEIQNYVAQLKELGDNPMSDAPLCRINSAVQPEKQGEQMVGVS